MSDNEAVSRSASDDESEHSNHAPETHDEPADSESDHSDYDEEPQPQKKGHDDDDDAIEAHVHVNSPKGKRAPSKDSKGSQNSEDKIALHWDSDSDWYPESDITDITTFRDRSNPNLAGINQVDELSSENIALKKRLIRKTKECDKLKDALVVLQDEIHEFETQESPEKAAKDIAKKNRNLKLSLQKERAKNAQLLNEIEKFKTDLAAMQAPKGASLAGAFGKGKLPEHAEQVLQEPEEVDVEAVTQEAKEWKDKFHRANKRLMDARTEAQKYKTESVQMRRALQKEIGDDYSVDDVLAGNGNWRGRAQRIVRLKGKLRGLQKELEIYGGKTVKVDSFQVRNENHIEKIKEDKVSEINSLKEKVRELDAELARTQNTIKGVKARNRNLEQNVVDYKGKIKVLLENAENDDRLIEKLRAEATASKRAGGAPTTARANSRNAAGSRGGSRTSSRPEEKYDTDRVLEQQRQIETLKEQLEVARSSQAEVFAAMKNDWDRSEKDHKIQFLHVENEKRKELVELYSKKLSEADARIVDQGMRLVDLQQKLERATVTSKRRPESASAREKVKHLTAERDFLTKEHSQAVAQKEEELRIVHDMMSHQRQVHQRAVNGLRQQFLQIQARLEGRSPTQLAAPPSPNGIRSRSPSPPHVQNSKDPSFSVKFTSMGSPGASPRHGTEQKAVSPSDRSDHKKRPGVSRKASKVRGQPRKAIS